MLELSVGMPVSYMSCETRYEGVVVALNQGCVSIYRPAAYAILGANGAKHDISPIAKRTDDYLMRLIQNVYFAIIANEEGTQHELSKQSLVRWHRILNALCIELGRRVSETEALAYKPV